MGRSSGNKAPDAGIDVVDEKGAIPSYKLPHLGHHLFERDGAVFTVGVGIKTNCGPISS
jgi:hypothetical protein